MEEINPIKFYGLSSEVCENEGEPPSKRKRLENKREIKRMPVSLLGPTDFWSEHTKQNDAIRVLKSKSTLADPLHLFVYQDKQGFRRFVAANPEAYWWYYDQHEPENKCSYEVIMENEPSYVYFDLEFIKEQNPEKNGRKMTSTLIEIVLAYMLKTWNLKFTKDNVINFDSTSDIKFSRHLIFNTGDIAFMDNAHVGKFVKQICKDIVDFLVQYKENDVLKLFKRDDLQELIVMTDKGCRLFIDTAVYTKNRHFRIYKSTKWGKCSYLEVSKDCRYVIRKDQNLVTKRSRELQLFLDSLISFFPDKKKLNLLEFNSKDDTNINEYNSQINSTSLSNTKVLTTAKSQYPELDKHISEIIKPGRIRCVKYYEDLNKIIYEILGNRYCRNIGRSHKSNNIYWVVDLTTKCKYQKCHDEDCLWFASEPEILPDKVCFTFKDDLDICLSNLLPEP